MDLISNAFIGNFEESVNTNNNQETSVVNSDILQTLKAIQAQMGSFAKRLDNINSWREEVDNALTEADRISLTEGVEYQNEESPANVVKAGASRRPTVEASDRSDSLKGTEDDLPSLINGEVTSTCNNEANSLDIISESLDNSVKYSDPVSEKLAANLGKHYFDEKPKEKIKAIISKYDLPDNFSELAPTMK